MLVNTYYSRTRTTQAASRTFTISRLSDFFLLLAGIEFFDIFEADFLSTMQFGFIVYLFTYSSYTFYLLDVNCITIFLFCIFCAAACKCAQILLFV